VSGRSCRNAGRIEREGPAESRDRLGPPPGDRKLHGDASRVATERGSGTRKGVPMQRCRTSRLERTRGPAPERVETGEQTRPSKTSVGGPGAAVAEMALLKSEETPGEGTELGKPSNAKQRAEALPNRSLSWASPRGRRWASGAAQELGGVGDELPSAKEGRSLPR
jgi:hypothetical protein